MRKKIFGCTRFAEAECRRGLRMAGRIPRERLAGPASQELRDECVAHKNVRGRDRNQLAWLLRSDTDLTMI